MWMWIESESPAVLFDVEILLVRVKAIERESENEKNSPGLKVGDERSTFRPDFEPWIRRRMFSLLSS